MLPLYTFIFIVLVAGLATVLYYRSVTPVAGDENRPDEKPKEKKKKPAHRPVARKAEAASIPSHAAVDAVEEEMHEEEPKTADDPYGFDDLFLPEEVGIYHNADKLTERGRGDLDYTLTTLSRLPSEVSELLDVLNSPDSSAADVAEICERSVGLTARVLKLVNSPFYGLNSPVDEMHHAVTLLGFDEIRQIVLTTSLFNARVGGAGLIDIDELWTHSLATARITTWLADRVDVQIRKGLAGTGAILHDVGKVVLQAWRPEGFRKALERSRENRTSLMAEELKELGITHALAGVLLLGRWNLPVTLSWVVKGCHLPVISNNMPEAALVHLSGQIARHMAMGSDGESAEERSQDDLRDFLGISAETVTELVSEGFEDYVKSALGDIRVKEAV